MKTTRKAIREQVEQLQKVGADIDVNFCGEPRAGRFTNKAETQDISDRMSTTNCQIWLNGFKSRHRQ